MADCCQEKINARQAGAFEGPVGDDWFDCKCKKERNMVTVSTTKTFTLNQDNVLAIVAEYLSRTQNIHVEAKDLNIKIKDSQMTGYREDVYEAGKIDNISVTISI